MKQKTFVQEAKQITKKQGLKLLGITFALMAILSFIAPGLLLLAVTQEFIKFIIAISLSMAGLGMIAFQLKEHSSERDFINFSIIMVFAGIAGICFLVYPTISLQHFTFGNLSSFLFFWGLVHLLSILFEKKILLLK